MWTDSRFTKPRSSLRRERLVTFCVVQKVTKKHVLGRAKSCRWQVFVRRRPPKQGELRTDVSKATMFQGDRAAKDLIGLVQSFGLSVLIRGLQNLEEFQKVLILLVRGRCLGVLIRGLGNLELPERERFYSFRLYEKNGEYPRGLRTSGLRGRFKSPLDSRFWRK